MSKNNVNQTINEVKATTEVTNGKIEIETTTKVSKDVYQAYTDRAKTIVSTVNTSALDLATIYTEMSERKVLEYVSDDSNDKYRYSNLTEWANNELGLNLSEKQLNDYAKVVHFYGTQQEDGTYKIEDKYKKYTLSNLEIISRGLNYKKMTKVDFDNFVESNGINSFTSGAVLKEINNRLKGIENKDDGKKSDGKKDNGNKTDTIKRSEIKAQPEYKEVADQFTIVRDFITLAYTKADTKDFSKWFKEQFTELEKTLKLARDNAKK